MDPSPSKQIVAHPLCAGAPQRVETFDTLLKNASIFSRGCRPSRAWPKGPHTYSLSRVFSDVHAAGKHDLTPFRHLRTAELCEALAAQSAEIHFIDSLWRTRFTRVRLFFLSTGCLSVSTEPIRPPCWQPAIPGPRPNTRPDTSRSAIRSETGASEAERA